MSKKPNIFDFFRGKSREVNKETTNNTPKTTQSNKQADSYDSYLAGCRFSNYAGFLLEAKYTRDKFPEEFENQFDTVLYTCKQVFVISNIHYFIKPLESSKGKFVCYLNYENNDIRVICEFIKTLLVSNTNYMTYNIYYSLARPNPEEVFDDINFLINMPPYSLIFGFNKKIRAFYFKDCEMAPYPINSSEFTDLLKEKRLDEALTVLTDRRDMFARIIHTDFRYSYRAMYDFLIDTYLALKDFYANPEMPGPSYDIGFEEYLASFEDAAHFIDMLMDDLENYVEKYPVFHAVNLEGDLIRNVKEYIKNNVSTVTLQNIAVHFNVSYAHLSRLFKKNENMNFSEYVADVKLELAASLLKETDRNISEIAESLGYNSPSYFMTRFKDRYGVTPSTYRKQYFINRDKT